MTEFTPAAERALQVANHWTSVGVSSELAPPEVLIGLLAEPECRAALLLAEFGIDQRAVIDRWPHLAPLPESELVAPERRVHSAELAAALRAAEERLFEYPRPLHLATEHLLLGLVATESDAGQWLRERGLQADVLEAQVHKFAGHQPGPLAWDEEPESAPAKLPQPVNLPFDDDSDAAVLARPVLAMPDVEAASTGSTPTSPPAASSTFLPRDETALLRIIDASANRASEGLRVIEDYVRFVLDDRHLTEQLKRLRHELTQALAAFPGELRHAARDTLGDVGTQVTCPSEQLRTDLSHVVAASFKRLEQSLRSIEEFSKPLHAQVAAVCEQFRYRVYTLERAVDMTRSNLARLAEARLYVLVDGRATAVEFAALVRDLVSAGVGVIQVRDKQLTDRELMARARLARELTINTSTLLIINDRPDLAALCSADGVHLGQEELTVKDARSIVGPRALVGISCHSIEQARQAVLDGASYLGVGPTFPSMTKQFASFPGLELLRAVSSEIRLPSFAIGGINSNNIPSVLATGITRVAVSNAIANSSAPRVAALQLRNQLRQE